jgi:hypothetical protein
MSGSRLAAASGGLSAVALGCLLLLYLIPVYVPAPEFDLGGAPGPQAFPRIIASGFIILGGLDAASVLIAGERVLWKKPEAIGRLLLVAVIILAALLAIPYAGMIPVGIVMMVAITTLASGQRLLTSLVTAVVFALGVYIIFDLVAGIPIPMGSLWE